MSGQAEAGRRTTVDRSVDPASYFGAEPRQLMNASSFGLVPRENRDLYRVSYLFLLAFGNTGDRQRTGTEYGGIQVRAWTYLWLREGDVPVKLQRVMQRIAHRGAYLFDSDVELPFYGQGGGEWGGGYLSGFTPAETSEEYRNWEVEPVPSGGQITPGAIEWSTEVYLELDGTHTAELSGVGSGVADPYDVETRELPGEEEVEAQDEVWGLHDELNQARGDYQISPPAYTASRQRARNLHGKRVYINGLWVGTLDQYGRAWLKIEYQRGLEYRGRYSREGLIELTEATPQALRLGGNLYKYDESADAVHLSTARAKPSDFDPVAPDRVDPDLKVREGVPGRTVEVLVLRDPEEPTRQECRQDDQVIRHLGYSEPPYEHTYDGMWKWPGFRLIEEYGTITTPDDERPDDADLSSFGGNDE